MTVATVATIVDAALKLPAVATAAGLSGAGWLTPPHVFRGQGGFLGGRNRGRCPFVEYEIEAGGYAAGPTEGGALTYTVRVRVHTRDVTAGAAGDLTGAILEAARQAVIDTANEVACFGPATISPLELGPMGHQRDLTMTIEDAYERL